MRKSLYVLFLLIIRISPLQAQLNTAVSNNIPQLVQNFLLGAGITAQNVAYNGHPAAIGNFSISGASPFGFQSGIVLTTGTVLSNDHVFGAGYGPQGPNNSPSNGIDNLYPGDGLLNTITTNQTYNASILEFDFTPSSDSIKFRYSFGSEEYPEWVCSQYNDVFGFFISGPKPSGGNYVDYNIAKIPGSNLAVAINTINPGYAGSSSGGGNCTSLSYSNYYIDNFNGTLLQYDGLTTTLSAIAPVKCGNMYHIKIAIADVGDGIYDSGVFIEANSFTSVTPINVNSTVNIGSNNISMYEGCGSAVVYFTRDSTFTTTADTLTYVVSGSATEGIDYNSLNGQIIFPAGQDTATLIVNSFYDGIAEGTENIIFNITNLSGGCNSSQDLTYSLFILDSPPITINLSDSIICKGDSLFINPMITGGTPPYHVNWQDSVGNVISITSGVLLQPNITTYYIINISDICNVTNSDTMKLIVSEQSYLSGVSLEVLNKADDSIAIEGCDSIKIIFNRTGYSIASVDTFNYLISGSATNSIDFAYLNGQVIFQSLQTSQTIAIPVFSDTLQEGLESFIVTIPTDLSNPCALKTIVLAHIFITDKTPLHISTFDTVLCLGETILLSATASGGDGHYQYNWDNGLGSGQNHSITASTPTNYIVTLSDNCNTLPASDTAMINIHYNQPVISVLPFDSTCKGDNYQLNITIQQATSPSAININSVYSSVNYVANLNYITLIDVEQENIFIVHLTDKCGKQAEDSIHVILRDCELIFPNIITINHDGINDVLYFKNLDRYPNSNLTIYDRWGLKLFESGNYKNDYAPNLTDGVYFYILQLNNGKIVSKFFHVFNN